MCSTMLLSCDVPQNMNHPAKIKGWTCERLFSIRTQEFRFQNHVQLCLLGGATVISWFWRSIGCLRTHRPLFLPWLTGSLIQHHRYIYFALSFLIGYYVTWSVLLSSDFNLSSKLLSCEENTTYKECRLSCRPFHTEKPFWRPMPMSFGCSAYFPYAHFGPWQHSLMLVLARLYIEPP